MDITKGINETYYQSGFMKEFTFALFLFVAGEPNIKKLPGMAQNARRRIRVL
jgi:hypothetical protein